MGKKIFSIIIPVYKVREQYLRECLNSVVHQTLREIEIILVDDGSPDNCGMICDEYAAVDSRIKVIHQENQGVSVARNHGMQIATGEWVMFVDSDDWLQLDACEKLKGYLSGKQYDILVFRAYREKVDGTFDIMDNGMDYNRVYCTDNLKDRELLYRKAMQPANIVKQPISKCTFYYVWDKVFRKDFIDVNNLKFPVGIPNSEDKIFILRCFKRIKTLYCVDEVLYHYRIISSSATRRYSETVDADRIKLLSLLKEIAIEMDRLLSELTGDKEKHVVEYDYLLFTYMISSVILMRKFYHPDYPMRGKQRKKNALMVLRSEPFYTAIREIPYSDLSFKERIRKWLLSKEHYYAFVMLCRLNEWRRNRKGDITI